VTGDQDRPTIEDTTDALEEVVKSAPVLVTGATGKQGGAVARALVADGIPVRALVRAPESERAKAVEALGIEVVRGDLMDLDSIARAVDDVRAVFSVQMPPFTAAGIDFDAEVAQGSHLVDAAIAAGVEQFVYSSVTGTGRHTDAPGWADGRWAAMEPALNTKITLENKVREAGFKHWTILKPAFFMENFLPAAMFMFPRGVEAGLITAIHPHTMLSVVAVDDIGRAAAATVAEPARFHQVELELASDYLPMTEVAAALSRALGVPLAAPDLTEEEALAAGMPPFGSPHAWLNDVGQPARADFAHALGIKTTTFEEWAQRYVAAP